MYGYLLKIEIFLWEQEVLFLLPQMVLLLLKRTFWLQQHRLQHLFLT